MPEFQRVPCCPHRALPWPRRSPWTAQHHSGTTSLFPGAAGLLRAPKLTQSSPLSFRALYLCWGFRGTKLGSELASEGFVVQNAGDVLYMYTILTAVTPPGKTSRGLHWWRILFGNRAERTRTVLCRHRACDSGSILWPPPAAPEHWLQIHLGRMQIQPHFRPRNALMRRGSASLSWQGSAQGEMVPGAGLAHPGGLAGLEGGIVPRKQLFYPWRTSVPAEGVLLSSQVVGCSHPGCLSVSVWFTSAVPSWLRCGGAEIGAALGSHLSRARGPSQTLQ